MHIAIIGSRTIHIIRWANVLAGRGYQITLLSMHSGGEPLSDKVNVVKLPFPNPAGYLLNIPVVRRKIRQLNPDIVHSFYAFGYGFLGRMSGYSPHLVSVLGSDVYDDPRTNRVFRNLIIKNIREADHVCSTSHMMKSHTRKLCRHPVDISVTPFGVDTELFKPGIQKRDLAYNFVVGTVKAMKQKYGVDILIKAFAGFRNQYPDKKFKLILVGEGNKMRELQQLANSLNLGKDCEFIGNVPHNEVPYWLGKLDVFVAASRYDSESFGVAVLEAMACEKAVIVSDVGGLPEVVQHKENGLVVPKENVKATQEALSKLYEDYTLRNRLGTEGRKHVVKNYTWDESVEIMEQVYQWMLERKSEKR